MASDTTNDEIDSTTSALEAACDALRLEAASVSGVLNQRRNARAKIHTSLPPEVFSRIFQYSKPQAKFEGGQLTDDLPICWLYQLAHVCVYWWKIISSSSELWTTINSADPMATVALHRSRDLPLDVWLVDDVHQRGRTLPKSELALHAHRIKSISFSTETLEDGMKSGESIKVSSL